MLELFIKEHCSAKKELNISAFSLKSVTYLFWCFKGGIHGKRFYYTKTSSKKTNRISCWSLDQPIFLISGSSIFVYYFQLMNSVRFEEHLTLSNISRSLFLLKYFLYISFFSRINCFTFLLIHGGSLSSNVTVS